MTLDPADDLDGPSVSLGGEWWMWRGVAVRSAGFAIEDLLQLGCPELAAEVDAGLEPAAPGQSLQAPQALQVQAWATAAESECRRMARIVDAPRFREAIAWQHSLLVKTMIDPFVAEPWSSRRNNARRTRETTLARYMQRYHCRNETIGFFGSLGWGRWQRLGAAADDAARLSVQGAAGVVATRRIRWESWAIAALAERWADDPALRRQLRPALVPAVRVEDGAVSSVLLGRFPLSAARFAVLLACDGTSTLAEIIERLLDAGTAGLGSPREIEEHVLALRRRGIVVLGLHVPPDDDPLDPLEAQLGAVPDPEIRDRYLQLVGRLRGAVSQVDLVAGDAQRLVAQFDRLTEVFAELTTGPQRRRYDVEVQRRTLVVHDCTNTVQVQLGEALLADLAPALRVVLASARWLVGAVAQAHLELLDRIHSGLGGGRQPLDLVAAHYWPRCLPGAFRADVGHLVADLGRRWAAIIPVASGVRRHRVTADSLEAVVAQRFPARPVPWLSGHYHSPDLLLAASDVQAVGRGEYQWVLGEMHCGVNTLNQGLFVQSAPRPDDLRRAMEQDLGGAPWMVPIFPSGWPGVSSRSQPSPHLTSDRLAYLRLDAELPRSPVPGPGVPLAALVMVRADDGLWVEAPDGRRWHPMAVFGEFLIDVLPDAFTPFPTVDHRPRIDIDRLTVAREQWRLPAASVTWGEVMSEAERYRQVRRWARRLGLPRFVFVRLPDHRKPFYVDLTSPLLLNLCAAQLRRSLRSDPNGWVTVTEMHPSPDRLWLRHGAADLHCTSEFRVAIMDRSVTSRSP
ncbi:MAG: lantibiotic dehydratase [Kineosporiaceae bacterium]